MPKKKLLAIALDAATLGMLGGNLSKFGVVNGSAQFSDGLPTADDGLAFTVSQLAAIEQRIYEVKYRNIVYQDFVPVDMSDPEWIDEYTYFHYDAVTMGKFIGANAHDLPESTISAGKQSAPVFYGGNKFSYSMDELRKSQQLRMPLDILKGQASRRGFEEHAQSVAFMGDSDRNITGLFNNANVQQTATVVNPLTATGAEIVALLNGELIRVWRNSAQVHVPNVQVLPANVWAVISSKRMDSGTDTTVLEFYLQNNLYTQLTGQPLNVRQNLELETAGSGGVGRVLTYEMTDENLTMRMPIMWRPMAPQMVNLSVRVPAEYKFGGVVWRYPGSASYLDLP